MGLIVGNLFSLLAMVADSFSSSRKTVRGMLLVQCLGLGFFAASSICLKGYSAAVQNVVSIIRNLAAVRKTENKMFEYALIVLGVVLGVAFNNRGVLGLFPVIGNLVYSIGVFRFRDNERALKYVFLVAVAMFAVFNAAILNFVGVASNVVVVVVTIISLCRKDAAK